MSADETSGDGKQRRNGVKLSLNECQALRHLRAAGWSRGELKMVFEISSVGLSRHLDEQCDHPDVAAPQEAKAPTPEELLRFRYAEGLTQAEAADLFGVSTGNYSLWETGKRRPHIDKLREIREVLNETDLSESVPDGWRPGDAGRTQKWNKEGILDTLRSASSQADGRLTIPEYRRIRGDDMPAVLTIYKYFDSFPVAVERAKDGGGQP